MIITPKKELIIRSVILLIIIFFCIAIYLNGKTLECGECEIRLKTTKRILTASREEIQNFQVNINEIYESLKDDRCVLIFDREQGFIYFGGLNEREY